jgi:hypothetical protein
MRQQRLELGHGVNRIGVAAAGARVAADADHGHVERFCELGQPSADLPETDDDQRLAAELVLAAREVADHAAPDASRLVVARLRQPAGEREDQRHDVLGDRAGIDAAGARQPHAVLAKRLARELIGAGADRLDEAKPLGVRQEIVAPQAGDHQHVGLADPLRQHGAVAHLEAGDAGAEGDEALLQLIGHMREADRQLVLGREHDAPRKARRPQGRGAARAGAASAHVHDTRTNSTSPGITGALKAGCVPCRLTARPR